MYGGRPGAFAQIAPWLPITRSEPFGVPQPWSPLHRVGSLSTWIAGLGAVGRGDVLLVIYRFPPLPVQLCPMIPLARSVIFHSRPHAHFLLSRLGSFVYPIFYASRSSPHIPPSIEHHSSSSSTTARSQFRTQVRTSWSTFEYHATGRASSSSSPICSRFLHSYSFLRGPERLIFVVCFNVFTVSQRLTTKNEQQSSPFFFSCASRIRTHFHVSPFLKTSLIA